MKQFLAVCGIAILVAGCAPATQVQPTPNVTMRIEDMSETGKGYSVTASYPVIGGIEQSQAVRVNGAIKKIVDAEIAEFKSIPQVDRTKFPEVPPYELRISFDPHLVNSSVASIVFFSYRYTAGAHGGTTAIAFNYHSAKGREISLSEVFVEGSNYLEQLSTATIAELSNRYPDLDKKEIEKGAAPVPDNFTAFALTQDSLVIFFQEYQVGPYVIGMPRVSIPLRRLEKIIDPSLVERLKLTLTANQ